MGQPMSTIRVDEDGRRVFRLAGPLDAASAKALLDQVAEAPGGPLLLDFFNVASIDARALASLAEGLRAHPDVALRGLGAHQLRLLAYLGVEAARRTPHAHPPL